MWDGVELWLRKAGGLLLMGLVMAGSALVHERSWLPWRVMVLFGGIGAVVTSCVETWKLIHSRESTEAALDRLEAVEPEHRRR